MTLVHPDQKFEFAEQPQETPLPYTMATDYLIGRFGDIKDEFVDVSGERIRTIKIPKHTEGSSLFAVDPEIVSAVLAELGNEAQVTTIKPTAEDDDYYIFDNVELTLKPLANELPNLSGGGITREFADILKRMSNGDDERFSQLYRQLSPLFSINSNPQQTPFILLSI